MGAKDLKSECRKCGALWHSVGMRHRVGLGYVCPQCAAGLCNRCGGSGGGERMAIFHGQPICRMCLEAGKRADPDCKYCYGTGYDASDVDRWVRCSCRG